MEAKNSKGYWLSGAKSGVPMGAIAYEKELGVRL